MERFKTFLFKLRFYGGHLRGREAILVGYQISPKKVMESYLVIEVTNTRENAINGMVYKLEQYELQKADLYEGTAYKRIQVSLKSGSSAWVYIKA
ncbi:gamma-glutamylcyclotransferase [Zobellia uliginosa]|uniref:gamma-glutamylcyclotransferase n=1 Tax=Zobellia uliginosa TaxID=143224 RepID=UPI001C076686|nr:gamma-glutamylcyclotransferase [Zobellia uliginosa]MBU2948629.1 gamma-glutamylcyclotransferase [Zobellia uliginosa]